MAADRLLHSRIGDSEKIAKLTDLEFRVWITYLLAADDFGVLPMLAVKIQGADRTLANRKKAQIDRALQTIVGIDLVRRFEHQGAVYIYSPTWQTHQRIRYPRRTHYPCIPAVEDRHCDRATSDLFRKFHGKDSVEFRTPARAGGRETLTDNANASVVLPEGGAGETFRMDTALVLLKSLFPPERLTSGHRTETAFVDALMRAREGNEEQAFGRMLSNLDNQKRGHQWRVKGMVPALEKWLRDGLWEQEHDPNPPAGDQLSARTNRTLNAAAEILREGA